MIVEEEVVRLILDNEVAYEWRCTPRDLDALILGRLYVDRRTTTVGRGQLAIPDGNDFQRLFRDLFTEVDALHPDGGMHAAALIREGTVIHFAADVGRHNSVDKVIGKSLLAGSTPDAFGMIVTSRVSGEIARKAARSGVAWLASRSLPTTLAIALREDMPVIGRAAGKNAFICR